MFEPKDVITEAVERTFAHISALNRGAFVSWDKIEEIGFVRYTKHWHSFWSRLKARLLNDPRGIKLAVVRGAGVRLMEGKEQILDRSRPLRASRQLFRQRKEVAAVPDKGLNDHNRAAKHRILDLAKAARRQALWTSTIANRLAKPSSGGRPHVRPASNAEVS